jgi:hypothetical protein
VVIPDLENPEKSRCAFFSALWQADGKRIQRAAPADFIGRRLKRFFDYAVADEVHELANLSAQGRALGTLASCARKTLALTGTYSGGYADEAFNNLFRQHPEKILAAGFQCSPGLRAFAETYGVLEHITTIEPADNRCSEARITKSIKRRPGASPLLFGHFLMDTAAFLSLEDIAEALPPYEEEVLTVRMDPELEKAYRSLEEDIKQALESYGKSQSLLSAGMNALLLYPDRPFDMGDLMAYVTDPESDEREKILISRPADLNRSFRYAKERRLLEEVRSELAQGRKCQVMWNMRSAGAVRFETRLLPFRNRSLRRSETVWISCAFRACE